MLFKQQGIALHLNRSKTCRDWVRAKHLKEDVNVQDPAPFPKISFLDAHVSEPANFQSNVTNQSTVNDDPLQFWCQRYYDEELANEQEKAQYVNWFIEKYGVKPPVVVDDSRQPQSSQGEHHHATERETGESGDGNSDIGFFVNDTDDDYHSESELFDPYYCAPTVDMTGQPTSMYPPHVQAPGENQPPPETFEVQSPVKEIYGYEEPPVEQIENCSVGEDDFSDDGSIYANVSLEEDNTSNHVDLENADANINCSNQGNDTADKTRIDENTSRKVLSRNYSGYDQNKTTGQIDNSLHEKHKKYRDTKISSGTDHQLRQPMCKKLASSLQLMKIMEMMNAPLEYMSVLQEWARHAQETNVFRDKIAPPGRKETLKRTSELFDLEGLKPEICDVDLPKGKDKVSIVRFDFQEMVRSLLTDPQVAKDENWLFVGGDSPTWTSEHAADLRHHNNNGEFTDSVTAKVQDDLPTWEEIESKPETHRLKDLIHGEWYNRTYHMKCKVKGRDVLLPIILAGDKTHTDNKGHLCQEPILFTLGIFNRETRQLPRAWRPLGFIPNLTPHSKDLVSVEKIENYHFCLEKILESLIDTQSTDGIRWDLSAKGKTHKVVFKPEVCMFVGDNEGQTKACGMYQTRGNEGVKSLCRHCKVETCEIHRTYDEVYELHDRKQINEWIEDSLGNNKTAKDEADACLKACSHHPVRNAFRKISFGWFGVGNINAATPADLLHTINLGMMEKVEESILASRKPNSNSIISQIKQDRKDKEKKLDAKKKNMVKKMINVRYEKYKKWMDSARDEAEREDLQEELNELNHDTENSNHVTVITEAFTLAEMSKFLVFSDKVIQLVEALAKIWGWQLLHQSDRSIGRTHFVNGITGGSKVQANEMVGKLVIYLLIFSSDFSTQYFESRVVEDGSVKRKKAVHKGGQRELLNSHRVADYIWAIEEVLLLSEYLKSDLTLKDLIDLQKYTPVSMYRLKKSLNRLTGMGMNFIKYHLMSHRVLNYRQFGNPMQHDTEVVELSHRYVSKRTAKRTSRHAVTLDIQSSMRNWENLVVNRGIMDDACHCTFIKKPKEPSREDELSLLDNSTTNFVDTNTEADLGEIDADKIPSQVLIISRVQNNERNGNDVFRCFLRYSGNHKKRRVSDTVHWHDNDLKNQILNFMTDRLLPMLDTTDPIPIYHRLFRTCAGQNYLFKSDPIDSNHKHRGHGWHDWALVRLTGKAFMNLHAESAIHILTIIEIKDEKVNHVDRDGIQINGKGLYLIGHLLKSGVNAKRKLKPDAVPEQEDQNKNEKQQSQIHKKRRQGRSVWTIKKKKKPDAPNNDKPIYKEFVRAHAQSRLVMQGQKYGKMDKNQKRLVPQLCVVPAECITGVTIAVPNITHLSDSKKKEDLELGESMDASYLFINGKQHWPRIMGEWVRNPV
jgi:hypothetical protein